MLTCWYSAGIVFTMFLVAFASLLNTSSVIGFGGLRSETYILEKLEMRPDDGARWKVRGSLKLFQFILRVTWLCVPKFMPIHLTVVKIVHSKPHGRARGRVRGSPESTGSSSGHHGCLYKMCGSLSLSWDTAGQTKLVDWLTDRLCRPFGCAARSVKRANCTTIVRQENLHSSD